MFVRPELLLDICQGMKGMDTAVVRETYRAGNSHSLRNCHRNISSHPVTPINIELGMAISILTFQPFELMDVGHDGLFNGEQPSPE